MTTVTEMRCPANLSRLFAIARQEGDRPKYVDGLLMEFACRDCRSRLLQKEREMHAGPGTGAVSRVLHRFNIAGELVETEVIR